MEGFSIVPGIMARYRLGIKRAPTGIGAVTSGDVS